MMDKPIILHSEIKHKGFVELRVDKIQIPGMTIPYNYEVVTLGNAVGGVAVLPFLNKETLLLEVQYRHPVKEYLLEIVEGGIKPEESAEDAAKRELLEETGYAGKLEYMLTTYPLSGTLNFKIHIFKAIDLQKKQDQRLDIAERLEVITMPYEQVLKEVLEGKQKDNTLVTAVLYNELKYNR